MTTGTTDTLPIGPLQEGIWLFWRLNPASPAYSMPEVFHFDGDFDAGAAEFAFNETIRRHEALRTTFHETESGVVQVIDRDPDPVKIDLVDLRGLPAPLRDERLDAAVTTAANLPFDLAAGPPIRLTAIPVSGNRTTLVLVAHHIACDGTSMAILLHEFGELYRSARRSSPPALEPAAPGYGALVRRQLAALADGAFEEESAFWRERLAGATGSVLPGTAPATGGALDTCTVPTTLGDALADAVTAYARGAGTTPFSVLLCAMQVMIAAATADGDVAVGTATSGHTSKFSRTVGMLANAIVVRSRIDLRASFAEVLEEVALDLMDAIDHQDLPFSRMMADLHGAGHERGTELMRTMFAAGANGGLSLGEGRLFEQAPPIVEGPFELAVTCYIDHTGIAVDWEFALRAYTRETARGYCAAYQEILAMLLEQPDTAMDSLGLEEVLAHVVPAQAGGAPSAVAVSPAVEPAGPLTPMEEAVAAVWCEVLDVPAVAPHDDFFGLGGHSMLASQAVALVRRTVSDTASLRLLFDHPRLRDFCSRLEAR
ncbi:Phosphopantetheine attachment site [Lentzea xinjiangensis]|uniref:Phosphopantetheine attachment site n=1 Tax=Lentzea xinjiangensis TaxID=402600 RepID=A0A1H9KS14_9PSEU|nr:condensation domain-containing protein [Lentzea xinjiangensis]SER01685.1 Phosphopantetheine attachment site [Lentzea xinjiangensis]